MLQYFDFDRPNFEEQFEDTKGNQRRTENTKRDKRINNNLQSITSKTKDPVKNA